jgi:polyferredoxin
VIIYAAVLVALAAATAWSLSMRIPLKVNVLKDRGTLSREADDGSIENIYRLQIMNTGDKTRTFQVRITGVDGIRLHDDKTITVPGGEIGSRTASVRAAPGAAKSGAIPISFSVEDVADAAVAVTEKSRFWMP